jgi:hypothetical protein
MGAEIIEDGADPRDPGVELAVDPVGRQAVETQTLPHCL